MMELKERLMKLAELAKRGVGGEKDNAETILKRLLAEHKLTMDDINDGTTTKYECWFSYQSKIEKEMLLQLVGKILQLKDVEYVKPHGKCKLAFALRPAQEIEIRVAYSVYRNALRQEQEVLLLAFLVKHKLFGPSSKGPKPIKELTENQKRALHMAEGMRDVTVHKQIGGN